MEVPYYLGWSELIGERYPDAIRHLERGLAVSRQTGAGYLYVPLTVGLSWAFAETGRLAEAVDLTQNAVDSARLADNPLGLTLALGALGIWTMQSGDVTAALPMCAEAAEQGRLIGAFSVAFLATYWHAATLVEAGEPARAVELLAQQNFPAGKVAISCYEILASAELALGDTAAAQRWSNQAMAAADKFDTPLSRASALRANAALLLATGDPAAAAESALRAAEGADSVGAPIQAARARMLAAQALAQSDRDRAIAELSTAEATFAACGARRWRDEAALALRSLGQRAPARHTPTSDAPYGLSVREREVAALLAEGKTNRQIGQQLFIGVRTVETHVARILAKIGVDSRTAAATALTRSGQASSSP
jgi:DNA-binding NarL/FixJ family response regulator